MVDQTRRVEETRNQEGSRCLDATLRILPGFKAAPADTDTVSVAQYLDVDRCVKLHRHAEVLQIFRLLKVGEQGAAVTDA